MIGRLFIVDSAGEAGWAIAKIGERKTIMAAMEKRIRMILDSSRLNRLGCGVSLLIPRAGRNETALGARVP